MNSKLIEKGAEDQGASSKGDWVRPKSQFRNRIGSPEFPAEAGRYHLYIANNCPWCHRTALVRKIKGLEDVVSMDVLFYRRDPERGWQFRPEEEGCTKDSVFGFDFVRQIYERENSEEKSVPILFDKQTKRIVNNESSEIIEMLNEAFKGKNSLDLAPAHLTNLMTHLNSWIYQEINNGAYKAGFNSSQEAYELAYDKFFEALEKVEFILKKSKFIAGEQVTLSDIRLFPTIIRFDAVYYVRMKLNKYMIRDACPNIQRWIRDMLQLPGVKEVTNLEHCKQGYFGRNGNNIVPLGPENWEIDK